MYETLLSFSLRKCCVFFHHKSTEKDNISNTNISRPSLVTKANVKKLEKEREDIKTQLLRKSIELEATKAGIRLRCTRKRERYDLKNTTEYLSPKNKNISLHELSIKPHFLL